MSHPHAYAGPAPAAAGGTDDAVTEDHMLVVTSNDIPGWEIRQVCGEVFGLTVRSRVNVNLDDMDGGQPTCSTTRTN